MHIQETVWTPGRRPGLNAAVGRSPFELCEDRNRVWAAYLETEPPDILLCGRYLERDQDFPRLEAYLSQVGPSSLSDYCYALDTYRQSRVLGKPLPLQEPGPGSDPIVDEVLSATRGLLLWHTQMERLAQSLGLPRKKATEVRRRVNQKRPSALSRVEGLTFPSGQPFREIIEERLYYDGTVPGQWRSARILLEAEQ